MSITWEKDATEDTVTEWWMWVNGDPIGTMERQRPSRWHANGVSGLVRDRKAPWDWIAHVDGKDVKIPDGATVREAKALMVEALEV